MLSPLVFLMWSLYFFSYLVLWLSSFHFGLTVLFFVISICTLDFLQCKECKEDIVEKERRFFAYLISLMGFFFFKEAILVYMQTWSFTLYNVWYKFINHQHSSIPTCSRVWWSVQRGQYFTAFKKGRIFPGVLKK